MAASHLALTETLAFLFGGEIAWVVIPGNSCVRCSLFCTDTKLPNCWSFLSSLFPTSLSFWLVLGCNLRDKPNSLSLKLSSSVFGGDGALWIFLLTISRILDGPSPLLVAMSWSEREISWSYKNGIYNIIYKNIYKWKSKHQYYGIYLSFIVFLDSWEFHLQIVIIFHCLFYNFPQNFVFLFHTFHLHL